MLKMGTRCKELESRLFNDRPCVLRRETTYVVPLQGGFVYFECGGAHKITKNFGVGSRAREWE